MISLQVSTGLEIPVQDITNALSIHSVSRTDLAGERILPHSEAINLSHNHQKPLQSPLHGLFTQVQPASNAGAMPTHHVWLAVRPSKPSFVILSETADAIFVVETRSGCVSTRTDTATLVKL